MKERMEVIRKISTSQDPMKEMFISLPRRPGVTATYENSYHFWGPDYVNQFENLALNEPVVHKIRGADPVDVDGDLANLFGALELLESGSVMHTVEMPAKRVVAAKDPLDLIYFSSDDEVVAVLEFEDEAVVDPHNLVTVAEMPLKNWTSFKGPVASRETMIENLGLKPHPGPSVSKFAPHVFSHSSESLVIEFESSDRFDVLTTEDHCRVVDAVFPFALNEIIDLSEYPLIAHLTIERLTKNEHKDLKIIKQDSIENNADTIDE